MLIKDNVRKVCPNFILNTYRYIHNAITPAKLASHVVQIYVNEQNIESTLCFNNFLSFLNADTQTSGKLEVILWDADGALLHSQITRLEDFANIFLNIKSLLEKNNKHSDLGLVGLRFKPDHMYKKVYRKMGQLASHFFMFYRNQTGAVAMIHPSSTLDPTSPSSGPFISNQVVDTASLMAVTLYQCNPSQSTHELTIGLRDIQRQNVVCSKIIILPPMSVRKISFVNDRDFASTNTALRVFTSSLPTANSKPMLCRHYSSDRFSMSHS